MAVDPQRRRLTVGVGSTGSAVAAAAGSALDATELLSEIKEPVWSLTSRTDKDAERRKSFGNKDEEYMIKKEGGKAAEAAAAEVSAKFGEKAAWTCHKGLKPESPNQDSFSMTAVEINGGTNFLYGVYDGHGPKGHDVSDMARRLLVNKFLCHEKRDSDTQDALREAFVETQKHLKQIGHVDTSTSGSTCTLVYCEESGKVHVAYIGDSRCVVYVRPKGAKGTWQEAKVRLGTEDHKPNLPKEKARIEKAGGRVVFDGFYNHRVFAARGMYPGLNMSRAFGDDVAHAEAGLTAEPDVETLDLKSADLADSEVLMVICSDGVWEFIENEEATKILKYDEGKSHGQSIATLSKESYDRWMKDSDNEISDDITGMVVRLQ